MSQAHIGRDWKNKYPTAEQQAEFFLLKFSNEADLDREKVFTLKKQFEKFDKKSQGELEEDEAMQLLEARAETKTFRELRQTFSDIDIDQNHKLSFLEFACGTFHKSWAKLHAPSVDPEEIARAEALAGAAFREHAEKMAREQMARDLENQKQLEILRAAAERASAESGVEASKAAREALEAEIARQAAERAQKDQEEQDYRKKREEEYQAKRAAELAQKGVAGKAALFKYAAEDTKDATKSNEERIKAEAAKRKAEKEAKLKAEEDKKKAEEETAKAKIAAEEAAKKVAEAEEQAKIAAAEKAVAEAERVEAEKKAAEAEAERQKAMAGEEVARKEREAYEAQKAAAEAEAAAKKAAEEAKRNEGRAKIAARAALWNAGAPTAVFDELNKGGVNLNKTATRENNSALQTAKLFAGIQKGANLKPVDKPSADLTDAQKQAFVEDRQQQPDA